MFWGRLARSSLWAHFTRFFFPYCHCHNLINHCWRQHFTRDRPPGCQNTKIDRRSLYFRSMVFATLKARRTIILSRGGHWGVPNTAIPQKISTNTVIPQKNRQISQYRIESRWNTEIAETWYIIYILLSSWQELRGLGFSFVTLLSKYFFVKFIIFFSNF